VTIAIAFAQRAWQGFAFKCCCGFGDLPARTMSNSRWLFRTQGHAWLAFAISAAVGNFINIYSSKAVTVRATTLTTMHLIAAESS